MDLLGLFAAIFSFLFLILFTDVLNVGLVYKKVKLHFKVLVVAAAHLSVKMLWKRNQKS